MRMDEEEKKKEDIEDCDGDRIEDDAFNNNIN